MCKFLILLTFQTVLMSKQEWTVATQVVRARTELNNSWCGVLIVLDLADGSKLNCGLPADEAFCVNNSGFRTLNCVGLLNIVQ